MQELCPECGAVLASGMSCEASFHQMLYWENEDPRRGAVHHLVVLGYYLQHPALYSPEGLEYGKQLLVDFLEGGLSHQQVRQRKQAQVDSGLRSWKVQGTPEAHGAYVHPPRWRMTAQDVVMAGAEAYIEQVQAWARLILADLRSSGNLD
jgi:hypothetical protein